MAIDDPLHLEENQTEGTDISTRKESLSGEKEVLPAPKRYTVTTTDGTVSFSISPVQSRLEQFRQQTDQAESARNIATAQHALVFSEQLQRIIGSDSSQADILLQSEMAKKERVLELLAKKFDHHTLYNAAMQPPDSTYDPLRPSVANVTTEIGVLHGVIGESAPQVLERLTREVKDTITHLRAREQEVSEGSQIPQKLAEVHASLQEETAEGKERAELDERIKVAAKYLARLDEIVEHAVVDPVTGKISTNPYDDPGITDEEVMAYEKRFGEVITRFAQRTNAYLGQFKQTPGVLDARNMLGAIVVTYDSSTHRPSFDGHFSEGDSRGWYKSTRDNFLGLVGVDISRKDRHDGVEPTTSVVHELQHHTRSMSDYLITQDPAIDMQSAPLGGRSTALFGQVPDMVHPFQAYAHDIPQYTALLGREFTKEEMQNMKKQQAYLDELHSSYLQRKLNWFGAETPLYSREAKGTHKVLVGDNPEDQEKTEELLGYLQGFYTLDTLRNWWTTRQTQDPTSVGPLQQQLMTDAPGLYRDVGALIGAARTVSQAERLVADKWQEFIAKYPKVLTHPDFESLLAWWEKGVPEQNHPGLGVANLRVRLAASS